MSIEELERENEKLKRQINVLLGAIARYRTRVEYSWDFEFDRVIKEMQGI